MSDDKYTCTSSVMYPQFFQVFLFTHRFLYDVGNQQGYQPDLINLVGPMRNGVFGAYANRRDPYQPAKPEVIKLFSCSTQLSMKFHLVIKIKIPTIKTFFMLNSAEHAQLS